LPLSCFASATALAACRLLPRESGVKVHAPVFAGSLNVFTSTQGIWLQKTFYKD
jgi:hypothetical protein